MDPSVAEAVDSVSTSKGHRSEAQKRAAPCESSIKEGAAQLALGTLVPRGAPRVAADAASGADRPKPPLGDREQRRRA